MSEKPTIDLSTDGAVSDDEAWIKETLENHLDTQVDSLDYTVTSKLSAARHRALAQEQSKNTDSGSMKAWFSWPTAFGSVAALSLVLFASLQLYPLNPTPDIDLAENTSQTVLIEDLNLLSASDDIEFYQSVEFLEWVENNSG